MTRCWMWATSWRIFDGRPALGEREEGMEAAHITSNSGTQRLTVSVGTKGILPFVKPSASSGYAPIQFVVHKRTGAADWRQGYRW